VHFNGSASHCSRRFENGSPRKGSPATGTIKFSSQLSTALGAGLEARV
jgi:hypothetical protein